MPASPRSAIIIGAGPAGAMAGLLLARVGWAVTLIEQHSFPREKVCGECMSALGLAVLDRASLLPRLRELGMIPLRRASVWATNGRSINLALPSEMGGLSRGVLDVELRNAAARAGAQLVQPARCEGIAPGVSPTVRVRDLSTNQMVEQHADVVLVADGKGGVTAGVQRPRNGDLGVKCHLVNVDGPRDAIELFGLSGHYVGLAAIENDRWNLAMSVPKKRVQELGGDFDILLRSAGDQNPVLKRRLAKATRVGAWHSSPLPRYGVVNDWADGVVPIGNAAAALEPIGGEGMGLALRSAELAVQNLIDPRGFDATSLRKAYQNLWRERRLWCRLSAIAASHPWVASTAMTAVSSESRIASWIASKMGKADVAAI